ncbi:Hypothetical predicted protein [Octopus vulgaris]|uniref:Programmed cell death protein 7 n=1 Tax=Octopus vulgaris TaxID=6645 RepID=A0AA36FBH7_OCTVU|nr:Hypothetical predicted protein [Octopus vulgaris]
MNPSSSAYSDDTYYHQHHQRGQQSRPLPPPPIPPSQQHQPYDTNNDNFSSRSYGESQRTFRNFPPSEQQHRGTRYNHPDEGNYYKDHDSKNYPPPYGRTEGALPPYNYSDHPRSRLEQGSNTNNNNNNTRNMLHSNSLPPITNDNNYPPKYSRSGFRPEQFPNTNVPPPPPPPRPPPLHMHQQVTTRLPSQPPPTRPQPPLPPLIRDQAGFYSGVNYIPQQKNVATPEYPANFNLPPFPGLDTSCPPPSLPPLPPLPLPPVIPHTSSAPSSAGPSPLPPQYLKPCSAPMYLGTDSSNSIVSSIPSNATSVPPPPPLGPSFISPPPPPLADTLNTNQLHGDNNFNTPSNSGLSDVTLATSNFSVPPPLTPVYGNRIPQKPDSSVDSEYSQIDDALQLQRQQDKEWIKQKFSTKIQDRPVKKPSTITIWESQNLVRQMLLTAGQLHKFKKTLENIHETATEEEWLAEIRRIEATKETLEDLRRKITDKNLIEELEKKVKARLKKRARLKRLRKKKYEERERAMSFRKELHRTLDDWRDSISQKEQQIKQEKEMKVAVDSVLGEVRKKKSDVAKMLELIGNLSKLRKIRKENVAKKGLYTLFHSDKKFEEDISGLQRMLNNQMDVYEAEQRTLMVMLECEQEETKERERAKSHKVKKEIEKREKKRELQLLFGKDVIDSMDPCYPFLKYYTQAIDNWESFLQIRRDWDCYLAPETAPGASRIPDTWVLPPEPSNPAWARFLES